MSTYGPHDPYGQPNDPYGQQPPPPQDPYAQQQPQDPYNGGGYGQTQPADQYGGYPGSYSQPQPDGYGQYDMPVTGTPYSPAAGGMPPHQPMNQTGYFPPEPPKNNSTAWIVGGAGAVVLILIVVLVLVLTQSKDDDPINTQSATPDTSQEPSDEPSSPEPSETSPTRQSTDPQFAQVGDCLYAWKTDDTAWDAEIVDCDSDDANYLVYEIVEGTIKESDCPSTSRGKPVDFWYWVDYPASTTDDYVLCAETY